MIDTANLDVDKTQLKNDIDYLLEINENATEYGSIVDVKPLDFDKLETAIKALIDDGRIGDFNNLLPLVKQSSILAGKYDVVVTNPPYMGNKGMSAKLSEYMQKNYPDSKLDLFAIFIEVGLRMAKPNGYNCMVTMQSWMFLSSFEKMREKIIATKTIINLMHMAANMIGVSKRIIVLSVGTMNIPMINPVIIKHADSYETEEGCLSLGGVRKTTRYQSIEVEFLDRNFEKQKQTFTGFPAQIIQHASG